MGHSVQTPFEIGQVIFTFAIDRYSVLLHLHIVFLCIVGSTILSIYSNYGKWT